MQPTQLEPLNPFPRSRDGFGCNPLFLEYWTKKLSHTEQPSDEEWALLEKHFNIKTAINSIYDCAPDEIITRLDNDDLSAVSEWQPAPPDDNHEWFLVSIYDSEDGPYSLWAYALS